MSCQGRGFHTARHLLSGKYKALPQHHEIGSLASHDLKLNDSHSMLRATEAGTTIRSMKGITMGQVSTCWSKQLGPTIGHTRLPRLQPMRRLTRTAGCHLMTLRKSQVSMGCTKCKGLPELARLFQNYQSQYYTCFYNSKHST